MSHTQSQAPEPMADVIVQLGDLGLAPENLRFKEPADDGVPQLADTMAAAGVLFPPIVRPGRDGEQPYDRREMPMRSAISPGRRPFSRRSDFSAWARAALREGTTGVGLPIDSLCTTPACFRFYTILPTDKL